MTMPTQINRQMVSEEVLKVIQGWHFDMPITEETNFEIDLPIDKKAKALYYYAITLSLEKLGYELFNFGPEDCEEAQTVGDIVNAVWEDLNPDSKRVS